MHDGRAARGEAAGSRSATALAAVASAALGLWVLGSILDVLLLCFAGGLLGIFLHGTGAWIARQIGVPKRVMVGVLCLFLAGVAVIATRLVAPSVAAQVDQLSTALPSALERVTEPFEQFSWGRAVLERIHPDDIIGRRDAWSRAGGIISTTLGGVGTLVVIVFVGLFTAFDPDLYVGGLLRLVPTNRRRRARELLSFALLQGPTKALWVAGLYVGIQTAESYVLTPLMQKKMVSLPPALTLAVQVVMGTLAGGLGLAVATPMTAAALALIREILGAESRTPFASHAKPVT